MIFSSPTFIFFFMPAVFLLYRISNNATYRNILLAAVSIVFYAFGKLSYVPLLIGSVTLNYLTGLLIKKSPKHRKTALTVSVILNIGILCAFKYLPEMGALSLTLPLGISFFTFQGLSYVIDAYRNPECATEDYLKVLLYISFFPRLVAGPIVKYHEIDDQLGARECSAEYSYDGVCRFIIGLSKKLLLSDACAKIADHVFNNGTDDFRLAWLGAVCYALQIYYDFSGYSDMAIGLGKMFGFVFPENFNFPYGSASIREFWRKWHISLSSWFKEYAYIPLGGNRKGKLRAALNRMLVFICTGVWHGANLTYLVWGIGHGLLSGAEDFGIIPVKKLEKSMPGRIVSRVYTLLAVMLLFVIFRASSLENALDIIKTMFAGNVSETAAIVTLLSPAALIQIMASVILAGGLTKKIRVPSAVKSFICVILFVLSVMCMAKGNFVPFIYSQF